MSLFQEWVKDRILETKSVLCLGLDTILNKIPETLQSDENPQLAFNRGMIDVTHDLVCCYKPNFAFYTAYGSQGFETLKSTIEYAHSYNIPVILDAKFGDIGHTAEYYAQTAFDVLQADAVTLNPYMGKDSIAPFQHYEDRSLFILCFTSNISRIDLQTQMVSGPEREQPLYEHVARKIVEWNTNQTLGAVVGATAPEELAQIRQVLGEDMPVLCPGIGVQGGDLEEVLWAGRAERGSLIVNVSRAILYASAEEDFAEAARREAEMFVNQTENFFAQAVEEK